MIACAKGVARTTVKVAREADVPLVVINGVTVVLEDHGQDCLAFDIVDGRIVNTRPRQDDPMNGSRVMNRTLAVGDRILFQIANFEVPHQVMLDYPVAAVRALDRVRIGATDV